MSRVASLQPAGTVTDRVAAAVDRALDERQREATQEVERILAAAVAVMARVSPQAPRVSDIVAEAGVSNKAFYRYFAGKDDLILAVMERGVALVVSYLSHQMDKADNPADKVARWIEGCLAQVSDPHLRTMSRAVGDQMSAPTDGSSGPDVMAPMRALLHNAIASDRLTDDPERDTDAVFRITAATMRHFVDASVQPDADDVAHLVRFCLRGLDFREEHP